LPPNHAIQVSTSIPCRFRYLHQTAHCLFSIETVWVNFKLDPEVPLVPIGMTLSPGTSSFIMSVFALTSSFVKTGSFFISSTRLDESISTLYFLNLSYQNELPLA